MPELGDAARVFLLPQELWENLPKTATTLRDKTLMKFERENMTRLEIQAPNEHIVITNSGPRQYTMEQPVHTPGDGDAIYSLLWDIQDLKAKDFVAETPDALDLYGLDVPQPAHHRMGKGPYGPGGHAARTDTRSRSARRAGPLRQTRGRPGYLSRGQYREPSVS